MWVRVRNVSAVNLLCHLWLFVCIHIIAALHLGNIVVDLAWIGRRKLHTLHTIADIFPRFYCDTCIYTALCTALQQKSSFPLLDFVLRTEYLSFEQARMQVWMIAPIFINKKSLFTRTTHTVIRQRYQCVFKYLQCNA